MKNRETENRSSGEQPGAVPHAPCPMPHAPADPRPPTPDPLPKGFVAAGVRCGIKQEGLDLALIYTGVPAACAALFTTNAFKAAPVLVSQQHSKSGKAQAIVANSGCANACTGKRGLSDAMRMAQLAADVLYLHAADVLVCSTGIIGQFLPMQKVEQGIAEAASTMSGHGGLDAARAIMTTDTRPKIVTRELKIAGKSVRISGVAKGSGMIAPNVATMLCFIVTDAAIDATMLRASLVRSAEGSFNSLTIDGDMSTNDAVIALANGMAKNPPITTQGKDLDVFQAALDHVMVGLAREVAMDGEGATKLVQVVVKGAATYADAKSTAMTIANSPLVKTAIFGQDPNWGRVLAAAGRSGVPLDPEKVDLYFDSDRIVHNGAPVDLAPEDARRPMLDPELKIVLDLKMGSSSARVFTCDFSYDYVKINAEYHT